MIRRDGVCGHLHHRGGEQYRIGSVDVQSPSGAQPVAAAAKLRTFPGDVYNAEAVEKTVEEMTIEAASRVSHLPPFARAARDNPTRTVARFQRRGGTTGTSSASTSEAIVAPAGCVSGANSILRRVMPTIVLSSIEPNAAEEWVFKSVKITPEPGSAPDRAS
jgi:outer membrane protein insertion porin family